MTPIAVHRMGSGLSDGFGMASMASIMIDVSAAKRAAIRASESSLIA